MSEPRCLTILPSLAVARRADGGIVLTGKLVSGLGAYQRLWKEMGGGRVVVAVEEGGTAATGNLDDVVVRAGEMPWEIEVVPYEKATLEPLLRRSAVVLLASHYRQTGIGNWCGELSLPAVYATEYSLRTGLQILATERMNPLVRLRRKWWLHSEQRRVRAAIQAAAGVQCNGTPTYEAYRGIACDALLYFDTRVSESMVATAQDVERRVAGLRESGVLRLAFSGRLIAMKGADRLVEVAGELARLGVKFEFSICGAGPLEEGMRREAAARGLGDRVLFKGSLDFERELVPFVREHVDLFVCCHPQGDPSCTYLETMACGVPIAGYGNEAFEGVVKTGGSGWVTPMDRPKKLAEKIARLGVEEIERHSLKALSFAREHTFEKTFARRLEQLWRLARK